LSDPRARDYASRDFKRHLKVDRGWKPASVNLALAAVDHFNRFLGLGPANVKREPLAQSAPRALSGDEQRALLRAAEASRPRDRAIVVLLLYTMPRLHELAALNIDDISMSARKGLLVIRSGKGDVYREVPLNPSCRNALEPWIKQRGERVADGERTLFVGPKGRRLSQSSATRSIRHRTCSSNVPIRSPRARPT